VNRKSKQLFARAKKRTPGGVNSPLHAFGSVGAEPRFIRSGRGSRTTDEDGRTAIDYAGSRGALILGHAPATVRAALRQQTARGAGFGAPTGLEVTLAEMICEAMPSMARLRLVNSGTEAAINALRLARAFTERSRVIKFDGCFHGHADGMLVRAGAATADSPGVPLGEAANTISLPYNNLEAVERALARHRCEVAAVIVEPVMGSAGTIPPARGFLQGLKKLTREHGALLVFDEVLTGFRLGYGGAQEAFGVRPDLTCLGRIIGGGMPVGAFGGAEPIMNLLAPSGPVAQAGALSGGALTAAAGIATLKALKKPGVYRKLERLGEELAEGLALAAERAGVAVQINRAGSMFTVFFCAEPVRDCRTAYASSAARYAKFFQSMLEQGVCLAPSQFEACFLSLAHTPNDVAAAVRAGRRAFETAAQVPA